MRRRPAKSGTPLNAKQDELTQREEKLRAEMQRLERMIEEAPRLAEETSRRQREELLARASQGGSRLDVSIALMDKRWSDHGGVRLRPGSLRKHRREGRIVFIVLLIALSAIVLWLASHLHF
jgi:hypothetical protein